MEFKGIKCDKCGGVKGETNHWWFVVVGDDTITIWSAKESNRPDMHTAELLDACSQKCVSDLVSSAMARLGSSKEGELVGLARSV